MNRKDRIRKQLTQCVEDGVLRHWYTQGNMPGLRGNVHGYTFSSRAYSTSEIEAFLVGVAEGRYTHTEGGM